MPQANEEEKLEVPHQASRGTEPNSLQVLRQNFLHGGGEKSARENPLARESPRLFVLRQSLCSKVQPSGPRADPHRGKTIHLQTLR